MILVKTTTVRLLVYKKKKKSYNAFLIFQHKYRERKKLLTSMTCTAVVGCTAAAATGADVEQGPWRSAASPYQTKCVRVETQLVQQHIRLCIFYSEVLSGQMPTVRSPVPGTGLLPCCRAQSSCWGCLVRPFLGCPDRERHLWLLWPWRQHSHDPFPITNTSQRKGQGWGPGGVAGTCGLLPRGHQLPCLVLQGHWSFRSGLVLRLLRVRCNVPVPSEKH